MIRTLTAAIALLCLAVVANAGPAVEEAKEAYKPSKGDQATDMIVDMYVSGKMKASYYAGVHKDPVAGQYWVTKSTSRFGESEHIMTTAWQVAKVVGTKVIVENDPGQGYVLAYEVDTTKKADEHDNVTRAWIGKPGKAPKAIEVMVMPKPDADEGGVEAPQPEPVTEDFSGLKLAGGVWSGKKTSFKMDNYTSTTWIADKGWFGGMVKLEYSMANGNGSTVLEQFGDNGEPWLKWDEVKDLEKPATGEKAEEKKPESTPEKKPEATPEKKPETSPTEK